MRLLIVFLCALVLVVSGCGGDEESAPETTGSANGECEQVDAPEPRDPEPREAPTGTIFEPYALTLGTSCGSFTVTLDLQSAPNAVSSLVALADDGYFDDTIFHRVVPGFVVQGGDPTQTGAGGPGYSTVDIPPSDAAYTKGVVAMAKAPTEPPGTAGSQFFVVTADDAGLPPDYAIVGEVTEGMETVERINALGVGDGPPSQTVVVNSVTATQTGG